MTSTLEELLPVTARNLWCLLTSSQRRRAIGLFSLMLLGMALETFSIGLVIPVIAFLTQPDYAERLPMLQPLLARLGNPSTQAVIFGVMLGLTFVYLAKNSFLAFLAWVQTRFAFEVQAELSQRLFTSYLRQPYTFHLQRNSSELLRNVISEVSVLTTNGLLPGMLLMSELLVLAGLCTLLLVFEPMGALIVVGVLGLAAWGFQRLTSSHIARWAQARQYHEGLRIQHLQQGLGSAKDLKVLGRESDFIEQYRVHNVRSARTNQLHATLKQIPRLWLELLAVFGLTVLVISLLAQGRATNELLPTLGLFAAAGFRLMPSINRALGSLQSLRFGVPVINTLFEELQVASPPVAECSEANSPFRDALKLSNVTFAYASANTPALHELSIIVRRGETVGFVGASGAGKSTLVNIVLGLLTPDTGKVSVDGVNIQDNLRNWQNQIGYVPQSIYLTDDSLRRNVAFGLADTDIDEKAVWRALCAAQLDEFVNSLPEGLNTAVGERGVRLSGGQQQRIGIARALYHDPAVLVLDEATSALDVETERGVMAAVRALHGAKTILIVAHRFSTVEHCDRLYRFAQGRVVMEGVPAALLQQER